MSTGFGVKRIDRDELPEGEVLCEYCTAKCCRYFALPIETPTTKEDFEFIRWYLLHERATVFTDEVAQSVTIGEAQHAVAAGLIAESDVNQIGAVINGSHPGRRSAEEITLFDGTGVGLQDLAVAAAVVDLAVEKGIAIEVDF